MPPYREHESIRILVVGEEPLVCASLVALVSSWDGFQVLGEAAPDEAIKQIRAFEPDVVLLSLAGADDIDSELTSGLSSACGRSQLVVLVGQCHDEFRLHLLRYGVSSVITNTEHPMELRKALEVAYGRKRKQD